MKLINAKFDPQLIDDRVYDKKGRIRRARRDPWDMEAVDFSVAERELELLIGHAYKDERAYHPVKQGMRKRYRGKQVFVEWWDERGSGQYNWAHINNRIYGLIDKYIGKKFDDCFSALKDRVRNNKDWWEQACGFGARKAKRSLLWEAYRRHFLDAFEDHPRWQADYYVDDDGLIQKRTTKPKHPNKDIHEYVGEAYYAPNYGAIKQFAEKIVTGFRVDITPYLSDKMSHELIHRWESSARPEVGYWEAHKLRQACFQWVDNREVRTIKYRSKKWYAKKGFQKKTGHTKLNHQIYDRSLWVQKYKAKHGGELGMTFHNLLYNDPADIRESNFIEVANAMFRNPSAYVFELGCTKQELFAAIKNLFATGWIRKRSQKYVLDTQIVLGHKILNELENIRSNY